MEKCICIRLGVDMKRTKWYVKNIKTFPHERFRSRIKCGIVSIKHGNVSTKQIIYEKEKYL